MGKGGRARYPLFLALPSTPPIDIRPSVIKRTNAIFADREWESKGENESMGTGVGESDEQSREMK